MRIHSLDGLATKTHGVKVEPFSKNFNYKRVYTLRAMGHEVARGGA